MQYLDRSTLSNWVKYMVSNPLYFESMFGLEATAHNMTKVACSIFGKHNILPIKPEKHRKPRAPIVRGIASIGLVIGLERTQVYRYKRGHSLPYWMEGRTMCAYVGRLNRWAKARQVGRFNGR